MNINVAFVESYAPPEELRRLLLLYISGSCRRVLAVPLSRDQPPDARDGDGAPGGGTLRDVGYTPELPHLLELPVRRGGPESSDRWRCQASGSRCPRRDCDCGTDNDSSVVTSVSVKVCENL